MKRFSLVLCLLVLAVSQLSAAEEAKSGRFLHEIVASSQPHRESLQQLLRKTQRLPPWVRNMITNPLYVSGASTAVTIAEKPFELFGACLVRLCPKATCASCSRRRERSSPCVLSMKRWARSFSANRMPINCCNCQNRVFDQRNPG